MTEAAIAHPTEELAAPRASTAWWRTEGLELGVAVAAFGALCLAVLVKSTKLLEPDDLAYRASIVALRHGHLTLTNAQYQALSRQLGGISQWVQLSNGSWISEKNPGYPFFAVPFQLLGDLRLAPLFYGALGCLGLFFGGRRWLGRWGGTWAVVLYCSSGAALAFAWRATMPTFTDASLVAASTGALLWAMLAVDATRRRRTLVGLLAFVALEGATFIRYTDLVVLLVAVAAVILAHRAARVPRRTLAWWLGSVAVFGAIAAGFDAHFYGGVTKTGYSAGEITFGLSAVVPNLEHMPFHLFTAMPVLALAFGALGWIGVRTIRSFGAQSDGSVRSRHRRDAVVAAALAASWLGIFGLYAAYTWTTRMASGTGATIHVVRFYLPALAAIALLAAWLVRQLPYWAAAALLAAAVGFGGVEYLHLADNSMGGGLPGLGGGLGGPGGTGGPGGGSFPGGVPPGGFPGAPPGG